MPPKVHERIKSYIKENGLKQNYVAVNAGIDVKRFYRMLDGRTPMTADDLEIICLKGLAKPPAIFFKEIFSETENMNADQRTKSY